MPDAGSQPAVGTQRLTLVVFAEPVFGKAHAKAADQRIDIPETHIGSDVIAVVEVDVRIDQLGLRFEVEVFVLVFFIALIDQERVTPLQ
ncbi:hypothetical protein D3C76_1286730 [compost metagenome]